MSRQIGELLRRAHAAGIELRLTRGEPRIVVRGSVDAELLVELRQRKAELLAELQAHARPGPGAAPAAWRPTVKPAVTCHKFPDVVRLIQTSVPELKDQGRPPAEQKETLPRKEYGNSTEYLAARLKRDHPELLTDATATVAAVLRKHGGDRRSEKAKDQGDNIRLNLG
jgi:hypothetical protein